VVVQQTTDEKLSKLSWVHLNYKFRRTSCF